VKSIKIQVFLKNTPPIRRLNLLKYEGEKSILKNIQKTPPQNPSKMWV